MQKEAGQRDGHKQTSEGLPIAVFRSVQSVLLKLHYTNGADPMG